MYSNIQAPALTLIMDNFYTCLNRVLLLIIIVSSSSLSAAEFDETNTNINTNKEPIFVNIDWLAKHLNDSDIIIVDARTKENYQQGHINNAVNIPMLKTYKPTKNIYKMGNFKQIKLLFNNAGIVPEKQIVVYGDSTYFNASRVLYVFEAYGHKSMRLLETGYPGWLKHGDLPTSIIDTTIVKSNYNPIIDPQRIISKFEMQLAVNDNSKIIIDSRPEKDYRGLVSITNVKGKIPTAINIPATINYQVTEGLRHLKSEKNLNSFYASIDKSKKIYLYCNEGLEASRTYSIMRKLGFDVAQYDGSWFEWSNDSKLPIEGPDSSD